MKIARLTLIGMTMLSTAGCVFEHGHDRNRAGYNQPRGGIHAQDQYDHGPQGHDYDGYR